MRTAAPAAWVAGSKRRVMAPAVALNVLSDNSIAYANAEQNVDITQDN